jgi:CRP-like cAMP-binding protein
MAKSIAPPESLLAALPVELSRGLFSKALLQKLAADQTLFWSGDEGDGCYRVEEGLLKASVTEPGGGERILAVLGPGSIVRRAFHDRRSATLGFCHSLTRFHVEFR